MLHKADPAKVVGQEAHHNRCAECNSGERTGTQALRKRYSRHRGPMLMSPPVQAHH